MLRKVALLSGTLVLLSFAVTGCDSNPTNAPSEEAIKAADAARAKFVDNDPTMTPEQKQKLKEMMGVLPGGRNSGRK